MTTSPTQRTLAWLREQGYQAAVAERWNPYAKIRQDLFGWIDIVAYHREEPGIIGVQCTVDGSRASRRSKILDSPTALGWWIAGGSIWLVTWGKHGLRGKRKTWRAYKEEITFDEG